MSPTTIYLARFLGLYLILISIGMLVDRKRTLAIVGEMAGSGAWMLFSGMFATMLGLAIVLAHNVWSGGALSVAVTLLGWAALLKGTALLLAPSSMVIGAYKGVGIERYFHVWMSLVLAAGVWMAVEAFLA